jgi:hypothetical protein
MMKLNSLGALADVLEARSAAAVKATRTALREGAELVKVAARDCIGKYQPAKGDIPAWAPLSAATQADRVSKGFMPDDPLLRTGALRDAIEIRPVGDDAMLVGVFDPELETIAAAMEFGYFNVRANRVVPPRSFIRGTVSEQGGIVAALIGRAFIESME